MLGAKFRILRAPGTGSGRQWSPSLWAIPSASASLANGPATGSCSDCQCATANTPSTITPHSTLHHVPHALMARAVARAADCTGSGLPAEG